MAKKKASNYTVPVPVGYVPPIPDYGPTGQPFGFGETNTPAPAPEPPQYDDPGYYDAGGYAPAPPRDLASDPGWMALQAEYDREKQVQDAEAQRRRGVVTSNRDRLLADLAPHGEDERRNIAGGYEARGLFGGGAMQEATARQRRNEAQRSTSISADAGTQLSDIEGQLAQQLSDIERRRAEARAQYASMGYGT